MIQTHLKLLFLLLKTQKKNYITAYLISSYNRPNELKEVVNSIIENAKYPDNVLFAIWVSNTDEESIKVIDELRDLYETQICMIKGTNKTKKFIHENYNMLWKCYFKVADFICVWTDRSKMVTKNWDTILYNYYESYNKPKFACFQIKSNNNLNCDSLNIKNDYNNNMDFSCPIITKETLINMNMISSSCNIFQFLKYVFYISKIVIPIFEIKNIKLESKHSNREFTEYVNSNFYNCCVTKNNIENSILSIIKDKYYTPIGLWVDVPEYWESSKIIENCPLDIKHLIG